MPLVGKPGQQAYSYQLQHRPPNVGVLGEMRPWSFQTQRLLHGFDKLYFLLQQSVDHLAKWDAFLRRTFCQIGLYVGVQIDGQSNFSILPKELATYAPAEIILGFHMRSS
jgi:hypothetical protein